MPESQIFYPPKRFGIIFQILSALLLTSLAAAGLVQTVYASLGPMVILYLSPVILAVILVPMLAYRIYALRTASYTLEREGVHLRWGLRVEDIPIDHIRWVHSKEELTAPLPLPRFYWPGAYVGMRRTNELGEIEYLASSTTQQVILGTTKGVYVISPANPGEFLNTFAQMMEMGSLAPIPARSVYPTILLRRVWSSFPARILLLSSALFSLNLWVVTILIIPARAQVNFSFSPADLEAGLVPSSRLMLLPILNAVFFLSNLLTGLFFYRHKESQTLSFLLWSAGALLPLLFLIGLIAISGNQPV